jgi:hypothetical protein
VQELPIRSSFVGLQLDVGEGMIVDVDIPPYEDEVGIVLRERPEDED